MKLPHITVLTIVTSLNLGLNLGTVETALSLQKANQTYPQTTVTKIATQPSQTAMFQAGEHLTQGNLHIITYKGRRYIEFDKSFKTDNGPDLFVILHRDRTVPIYGIKRKDYKSIARLQKIKGTQRYAIPNNVNLADFKSVAVWCRQFNATFGFATLNG
ncbi:MAG: DM13 domain-containing protein [Methylacidiphilales bacterium]|nr:DM13 domain-containing protein [Candidatus Methylacidiphilales bacterium]NJR15370.1 DM13 domain-containing protein [Calothrix sp. CSU_2_0]